MKSGEGSWWAAASCARRARMASWRLFALWRFREGDCTSMGVGHPSMMLRMSRRSRLMACDAMTGGGGGGAAGRVVLIVLGSRCTLSETVFLCALLFGWR